MPKVSKSLKQAKLPFPTLENKSIPPAILINSPNRKSVTDLSSSFEAVFSPAKEGNTLPIVPLDAEPLPKRSSRTRKSRATSAPNSRDVMPVDSEPDKPGVGVQPGASIPSSSQSLPNGTKELNGKETLETDVSPTPPGANDAETLLEANKGIGIQMASMRTESKTNMDKLTTEINRLSANHIKLDSTIEELKTQQAQLTQTASEHQSQLQKMKQEMDLQNIQIKEMKDMTGADVAKIVETVKEATEKAKVLEELQIQINQSKCKLIVSGYKPDPDVSGFEAAKKFLQNILEKN